MKLTLIIITLSILPFIHYWLIKKLFAYKWLVNSILYPYHNRMLKKQLRLNHLNKNVDMWFEWQNKWFVNYWFGRKLHKIIADEIERVMK